jgi:signal transduction histidine kinase
VRGERRESSQAVHCQMRSRSSSPVPPQSPVTPGGEALRSDNDPVSRTVSSRATEPNLRLARRCTELEAMNDSLQARLTLLADAARETGRRKAELELQLARDQKMAAIGMLSAGVAHDFNNMLAVILLQAEVALTEPTTERQNEALTKIRGAGLRGKTLVRTILNFSRGDEPARHAIDASKVLGEAVEFLKATLPATIEVRVDLPASCPLIVADDDRLQQVFVNLACNAADAMPDGGVLTFRVCQTEL